MIKKMFLMFMLMVTVGFGQVESPWLRIDSNKDIQILWIGGSNGNYVHDIVYYLGTDVVEFSAGFHAIPSQAFGLYDIYLLGGFMSTTSADVLFWMPQVYWFSTGEKHYSELWYVGYVANQDYVTNNHWMLGMERYAFTPNFKFGPHVEWMYDYELETTTSLKLGAGLQVPYGEGSYIDFALTRDIETNSNAMGLTFFRLF